MRTKKIALATLVAAAVALTGCGANEAAEGNPAADGAEEKPKKAAAVYEFDNARVADADDQVAFVTSEDEVTVRLSDELASALPDGRTVAVDHYVLSAKSFSTGICRLDAEIVYKKGGVDALTAPRGSANEIPAATLGRAIGISYLEQSDVVAKVPSDDEIEEGRYITDDYSHVTVVSDCSEDTENELANLYFPYIEDPKYVFADVDVTVFPEGTDGASIAIMGQTDADLGVTGAWTKPTTVP